MNDKYAVIYKDKIVCYINPFLVEKQYVTDDELEQIKDLHVQRLAIEDEMAVVKDRLIMKSLVKDWENVQFLLQDMWGFARNEAYHKFWDIPTCLCAKLDNEDNYPTGPYYINGSCPVHGD